MRVISGRFKGMALTTPKPGTRPTTDRTKEAIFSHLDSWGVLDDARVLDLFAGTGALGIEALSRGARELVAVESAAPAAALIAKTLTALKHNRSWEPGMSARVVKARAEKYAAAASAIAPFGVIFIDPPYAFETEACNQLLADLAGRESGELTGWSNNDYPLFGEEARKEAKDAGRIVATTKTGALRIRKEPSADAAIYDLLDEGAKYEVVDEEQIRFSEDQEITADWVAVNYGGKTGYVSSEYVQVDFEIDYGETVEQVKAHEEAEAVRLQAEKEAAAQKQKKDQAAQAEKEAD